MNYHTFRGNSTRSIIMKKITYPKFSDSEYDMLIQNRNKVMRKIRRIEKKIIKQADGDDEGSYPAYKENPLSAYQDYLVYLQRMTDGMLQKMKSVYGDLAL